MIPRSTGACWPSGARHSRHPSRLALTAAEATRPNPNHEAPSLGYEFGTLGLAQTLVGPLWHVHLAGTRVDPLKLIDDGALPPPQGTRRELLGVTASVPPPSKGRQGLTQENATIWDAPRPAGRPGCRDHRVSRRTDSATLPLSPPDVVHRYLWVHKLIFSMSKLEWSTEFQKIPNQSIKE